jgi:electron transport complex protein RnfG
MKPMIRITLTLAVVCTIAAAGLAAVNQVTQKAIAINSQKELKESLALIFPQSERFEPMVFTTPAPENSKETSDAIILELYRAVKGNDGIGYIFKVETKGYGGQIILLIAISTLDQKMVGMKILEHQETAGLGSEITSSHFQEQFQNKPLTDSFELNRDIQALSGATISSRAVIRACQGVLSQLGKEAD